MGWREVDLLNARDARMTSQENLAVHVIVEKQHLPLQRVPQQQEIAGVGAKKTLHLGGKNVSGEIVMDVHRVRQDGFRDVKSCLCDGTMHSDIQHSWICLSQCVLRQLHAQAKQ